jgi:hypothetical protein
LREPKTNLQQIKVVGMTPEGFGVYLMPDGTERVGTTKLDKNPKGKGQSISSLNQRYAFNIS